MVSVSNNPLIGVLPPGPILNDDLIRDKHDLRININYKAVSPRVWYLLN